MSATLFSTLLIVASYRAAASAQPTSNPRYEALDAIQICAASGWVAGVATSLCPCGNVGVIVRFGKCT